MRNQDSSDSLRMACDLDTDADVGTALYRHVLQVLVGAGASCVVHNS